VDCEGKRVLVAARLQKFDGTSADAKAKAAGSCEIHKKRRLSMRRIVGVTVVALTVAMLATLADAMDTKAAGKCVVLGALSTDYEPKATVILARADAQGYTALVKQRAHEEFAYLARNEHDDKAKKGWVYEAVRACDQF
jgi:hypothetical protein